MKLGILGTAEIAFRRFLPALQKCPNILYAGVASRTPEKGVKFQERYGGEVYESYDALLADESIDALYVPLPPALHYEWGKKGLESGKHLLMEKPFTTSLQETDELLNIARDNKLAVHENYMFMYHSQLEFIKDIISNNEIGDLRLIRINFGFPMRKREDFRYNKEMGGGALLDCGGYALKLASVLLGEKCELLYTKLNYKDDFDVDIYGSAALSNENGLVAQVAFGMDNDYRCELSVWGSKGTVSTNRIMTAPADLEPVVSISFNGQSTDHVLPSDDSFLKSIKAFQGAINDKCMREEAYKDILSLAKFVETAKVNNR